MASGGVIERTMVLMETDGTCVVGRDEHAHPNVAICFERGHVLRRLDINEGAPRDWRARFQHGDNPEHAIDMALLESPSAACTGYAVDEWVAAIHGRVAAPPATAHDEEGRDA